MESEIIATPQPPAEPKKIFCPACRSHISAEGQMVLAKSGHLSQLETSAAALEEKKQQLAELAARIATLEESLREEPEAAPAPEAPAPARSSDCVLEF